VSKAIKRKLFFISSSGEQVLRKKRPDLSSTLDQAKLPSQCHSGTHRALSLQGLNRVSRTR
jgi:hypothetical protein